MAVDMYLKLGTINGESEDAKYPKWIDVLAWSWGMSQSGTMHMGGGGGAGKVAVQDISVTKYVDLASADTMLHCCKGTHIPKAQLIVRKAGDNPLDYIKIEMTDCLVSSVSTGGSGGEDRLTENVSLNFKEVKYTYTEQKKSGGKGASPEMSWDIASNEAK